MRSASSPSRRLTRRSRAIVASAALATCLVATLTAGAAAATTTTMPAGGNFEATPLLYTTSGTAGTLAEVTSSQAAEADGNHYLHTLYKTLLGVIGANSATATITSPSFEYDQATPSAVAFSFERRSALSGVLGAKVAVAWSARLVNQSSGATTLLSGQTITESEALHTISVPVAPATLIDGDTYHLAITEEFSSLLGLIQSSSVDLDNVGLNVTAAVAPPPGGGEKTGSGGGGTGGGGTGGETGGGAPGSGASGGSTTGGNTTSGSGASGGSTTGGNTTGSGAPGSSTSGSGASDGSTSGETTSGSTTGTSAGTTGSSTTGGSTSAGVGSSASGAGAPTGEVGCLRVETVRSGRAVRYLSTPASAEVSAGHPLRIALTARAGHPRAVRYSLGGATLASVSGARAVLIAASQLRAGHGTVLRIVVSPAKGATLSLRVTIAASKCGVRSKATRKQSKRRTRRLRAARHR